jgi:hypothetical protein
VNAPTYQERFPLEWKFLQTIIAERYPGAKVVKAFTGEDGAVVFNIDDPANEFELVQVYVWPDGSWEASL